MWRWGHLRGVWRGEAAAGKCGHRGAAGSGIQFGLLRGLLGSTATFFGNLRHPFLCSFERSAPFLRGRGVGGLPRTLAGPPDSFSRREQMRHDPRGIAEMPVLNKNVDVIERCL